MKILITILAITTTLSLTYASIDFNLKYGMKNTEVSELQEFLIDKKLLTQNTGFFGLLTLKAVKNYQESLGLPNTGYVGSLTRAEINKELEVVIAPSNDAEIQETGTTTNVITQEIPIVIPTVMSLPAVPSTPTLYYQPQAPVFVSKKSLKFGCQQVAKTLDNQFVCNITSFIYDDYGTRLGNTNVVISYNDNGKEILVEDINGGASLFFSQSGKYTITLSVPSMGLSEVKEIEIVE
jgi:peptidoglycan hydrolase-like protein with peptidoglycan-binding domain